MALGRLYFDPLNVFDRGAAGGGLEPSDQAALAGGALLGHLGDAEGAREVLFDV